MVKEDLREKILAYRVKQRAQKTPKELRLLDKELEELKPKRRFKKTSTPTMDEFERKGN